MLLFNHENLCEEILKYVKIGFVPISRGTKWVLLLQRSSTFEKDTRVSSYPYHRRIFEVRSTERPYCCDPRTTLNM